jgi:hypothetical protein
MANLFKGPKMPAPTAAATPPDPRDDEARMRAARMAMAASLKGGASTRVAPLAAAAPSAAPRVTVGGG